MASTTSLLPAAQAVGAAGRGADSQGAGADRFNDKAVHGAVGVGVIGLGFQVGQGHGDFAVFGAAGHGRRERCEGRQVIDFGLRSLWPVPGSRIRPPSLS